MLQTFFWDFLQPLTFLAKVHTSSIPFSSRTNYATAESRCQTLFSRSAEPPFPRDMVPSVVVRQELASRSSIVYYRPQVRSRDGAERENGGWMC